MVALTDSIIPIMHTPAVPTPHAHPPTIAREAGRRRMKESAEWLSERGHRRAIHHQRPGSVVWDLGNRSKKGISIYNSARTDTDTDTDRQTNTDNTETTQRQHTGTRHSGECSELLFPTESRIPYPLPVTVQPRNLNLDHRGAVGRSPQLSSIQSCSTQCLLVSRRDVRSGATASMCPLRSTPGGQ